MTKKRNEFIDIIKGVAIILVVIGHCIQYGSGKEFFVSNNFFHNPLFKFIYSFHMPLFMLVSGYLFYFTIQKKTWIVIKEKIKGLLFPLISWNSFFLLISIFLFGSISPYLFIGSYFHTLWFLRALLFCCFVVLCINKIFKDNLIVYIILYFILHLIPNHIVPDVFVFVTPFFICGYLFNKFKERKTLFQANRQTKKYGVLIILFSYILLLYHFQDDYYAYVSKTYIFNPKYSISFMIKVNIFRDLTAMTGCISVISVLHYVYYKYLINTNYSIIIVALAKSSICIYIINHYLNEMILISLPINNLSYLYVIIESICILLIGYVTHFFLKKNQITRSLFLGGR